jgi:hypothetical protein
MIVLASWAHDFTRRQLARIIRTRRQAANGTPDERVKFMKTAWDAMKPLLVERPGLIHNWWAS